MGRLAVLSASLAVALPSAVDADARSPRCARAVALGNETTLHLHQRSQADLREFYWAYTARLQERAPAGSELGPAQDSYAALAWLPHADAIARSGLERDGVLTELARARELDLLDPTLLRSLDRALGQATPQQLALLLRADAPSLRAHLWLWLASTQPGGCALASLPLDLVEGAIAERSLVVEHGAELLLRPVADYVLAARARMIAGAPGSLDRFLEAVALTPSDARSNRIHPLTRATAHAIMIRRGQLAYVQAGLSHPYPAVRAAVALALLDAAPGPTEPGNPAAIVALAASDPDDRVTETLVGRLLADAPEVDGVVQPQGALAESDDPRIRETIARWQGKGDPLAPLPSPRPLEPAPAPTDPDTAPQAPAATEPATSSGGTREATEATEATEVTEATETTTKAPAPATLPSVLDGGEER